MDPSGSYTERQGQGLIRIQTESPYERLDPACMNWLNQLKQMWSLCKKNPYALFFVANFILMVKFFSQGKKVTL